MPKIVNKTLRANREPKLLKLQKSVSEPFIKNKTNNERSSFQPRNFKIFNSNYEHQKRLRMKLEREFRSLKSDFDKLKKDFEDATKTECKVCYASIHRSEAVYMGDCGHGACRSCFIPSVVHTALQLRQHNEVDTIEDSWRCFICREFNYSFTEYHRGLLLVRYVNWSSELRDRVVRDYRDLERMMNLAPPEPLHEEYYWQDQPVPLVGEAADEDEEDFEERMDLEMDRFINGFGTPSQQLEPVEEANEEDGWSQESEEIERNEALFEASNFRANDIEGTATSSEESLLENVTSQESLDTATADESSDTRRVEVEARSSEESQIKGVKRTLGTLLEEVDIIVQNLSLQVGKTEDSQAS